MTPTRPLRRLPRRLPGAAARPIARARRAPTGDEGQYVWLVFVVIALLLLASQAFGHTEAAPQQPAAPTGGAAMEGHHAGHSMSTVAVSGDSEVRVDPDLATVDLGVTAQAADAGEAQQEVNRVAAAILRAVRALGIEEDAVQTSSLNLYPVYDNRRPREGQIEPDEPRIVAYRASNVVSVRVEDLTQIGPVIDASVEAGANQVQGVRFSLEDDEEARNRALSQAVQSARAKAQTMAQALGMTLGPVLQVEESGLTMERPELARQEMAVRNMAMDASFGAPVSTGQVSVRARVEVRYRLNP